MQSSPVKVKGRLSRVKRLPDQALAAVAAIPPAAQRRGPEKRGSGVAPSIFAALSVLVLGATPAFSADCTCGHVETPPRDWDACPAIVEIDTPSSVSGPDVESFLYSVVHDPPSGNPPGSVS